MRETPGWNFPLASHATLGLIDAYDREVRDDSLHIEHPDPPYAAWLVKRGSVAVRFAGDRTKAITAGRGEWLFLPAHPRIHQIEPGTRLLSIRMTMEHANGSSLLDGRKLLRLDSRRVSRLALLVARVAKHVAICRASTKDPASQMRAELELRAAFLNCIGVYIETVTKHGWVFAGTKPNSAPVAATLEWIARQGYARQLRLDAMARAAGMSLSHLKRVFRDELYTSPAAWWQRRRLKEACRQLHSTDLPLKAIAIELGFRFPSHFSAWFRQRTGTSPLEYRRRPQLDI